LLEPITQVVWKALAARDLVTSSSELVNEYLPAVPLDPFIYPHSDICQYSLISEGGVVGASDPLLVEVMRGILNA
jgi:hypothetical protein